MKDILSPGNQGVLSHIASSNALLAFDYDGTLAPIVRDPVEAHMRPRTHKLLDALADRYPCVVISGRAQEDIQGRLSGTGVFEIIGNHGLEPRYPRDADAALVQTWVPQLRRQLNARRGIVVENKGYSLAVHYRSSPVPADARAVILRAATGLSDVRVIGGKRVVNLLPRDGPNKGTALQTAREKFRSDIAVYLGDDDTDEDVFKLRDDVSLLTIRVGRKPGSRAEFYVANQRSVDVLLDTLVQLRDQAWRDSG